MKIKIILFSFCFFLFARASFAQNNKVEKSIIPAGVGIKKHHTKDELTRMLKGDLLVLYTERIETLIKILPYLSFATKPGVTMSKLGIPNNNTNRKILDAEFKAVDTFLESTNKFEENILPYSDTNKLISAILFYEEILKSLHEYDEEYSGFR